MKKILSILVVIMLTLVMTACNNDTTDKNTDNNNPQNPDATVITFSSWGLGTADDNNLLRRQIAKFNATHEDIQVEIVEPDGDWIQWLTTKAAAGEFPDIVSVGNVPEYVLNDWIGDVSSVIDDEWEDIPVALRESVTYGDKIYGIPSAYHYTGYFANLDLIDESGSTVDFTNFDFTDEEFFNAIKAMKDVNVSDGTGTIGIQNANDIVNWYPSVLDETGNIQHFVWDGESFKYNSEPMKQAVAKASEIQNGGYAFGSYSPDAIDENPSERELIFGQQWNEGAVYIAGQMGFIWDGSWAATGYENSIDGFFDYDFVGVPGGKVVGVSDYYGISKSANEKEAAYEVVKYLTFGLDGINDTFDIIEAAKTDEDITLTMPGLPINETQSIIDKWFTTYPQPGFKKAYEKAAAGEVTVLMEGSKVIPGYTNARWSYDTGIDAQITRPNNPAGSTLTIGDFIYDASLGKINYSDYMTQQISDALNFELLKAQNEINNK